MLHCNAGTSHQVSWAGRPPAVPVTCFELKALGPFSMRAAVGFLRGFTPAAYQGTRQDQLTLAFAAEDGWQPTAVQISAHGAGVRVEVFGPSPAGLAGQVARMLSLDVDGTGFSDVGRRDPVMAELQARYPGLRPVCYASPYDAAVWGILSHRIRIRQAAQLKRRLGTRFGQQWVVGDQTVVAFPSPKQLLDLDALPGVNAVKLARLHSVARAALAGELDGARLRAMPQQQALHHLMRLPGVGPFTAELILIRGAGAPNVLPQAEPRLLRAVQRAYAPATTPTHAAPAWAPYRSWCAVLLRTWLEQETHEIGGSGCGAVAA